MADTAHAYCYAQLSWPLFVLPSVCERIRKCCITSVSPDGQAFAWTEKCDVVFQRLLKQALTEAPIPAYPTLEDSFILDTDANNQGVGAVLSQVKEGKEKVIAYFSLALTKSKDVTV